VSQLPGSKSTGCNSEEEQETPETKAFHTASEAFLEDHRERPNFKIDSGQDPIARGRGCDFD
jgi:hypothetical protein